MPEKPPFEPPAATPEAVETIPTEGTLHDLFAALAARFASEQTPVEDLQSAFIGKAKASMSFGSSLMTLENFDNATYTKLSLTKNGAAFECVLGAHKKKFIKRCTLRLMPMKHNNVSVLFPGWKFDSPLRSKLSQLPD